MVQNTTRQRVVQPSTAVAKPAAGTKLSLIDEKILPSEKLSIKLGAPIDQEGKYKRNHVRQYQAKNATFCRDCLSSREKINSQTNPYNKIVRAEKRVQWEA